MISFTECFLITYLLIVMLFCFHLSSKLSTKHILQEYYLLFYFAILGSSSKSQWEYYSLYCLCNGTGYKKSIPHGNFKQQLTYDRYSVIWLKKILQIYYTKLFFSSFIYSSHLQGRWTKLPPFTHVHTHTQHNCMWKQGWVTTTRFVYCEGVCRECGMGEEV